MKRFLCGVEGVRLAGGREEDDKLLGGVLDLDGSFIVVEWTDSGDKFGSAAWGIELSNSSDRKSVEKVRLASSAA